MTARKSRDRLIPYLEQRALEDVAYGHGLTPTGIFALMLPVWQVRVKATTTTGKPYELIDRYLEKAIADAHLSTVPDLAGFLALDEVLVDRAVRFLIAIGHIAAHGGTLALTELGARSVREGMCYLVSREDRRTMYFDAFQSRPLTRKYYESSLVTLLALQDVTSAVGNRGTGFRMLHSVRGFRREALTELAANPNRDHYNLPDRIDFPESLGEELVYLPMYAVRAVDPLGRRTYLAYTQAADTADPDITDLCMSSPEIVRLLDNEHTAARPDDQEARIRRWLDKHDSGDCDPARGVHGTWRVVLPDSAFQPGGTVPASLLGSYVVLGQDVVHVWCEDSEARENTLLSRVDTYLVARRSSTPADVSAHVVRVARQLGFSSMDLAGLHRMAAKAGRNGLADELAALTAAG